MKAKVNVHHYNNYGDKVMTQVELPLLFSYHRGKMYIINTKIKLEDLIQIDLDSNLAVIDKAIPSTN